MVSYWVIAIWNLTCQGYKLINSASSCYQQRFFVDFDDNWDFNLEFHMLVALGVITTSEWSRSKLLYFYAWFTFSSRQNENESVKGTFISSSSLSTCSHLVSKLLKTCQLISPQSKEMITSRVSCFVIDDSCTRVWMSTFIHISPKVSMSTQYKNVNKHYMGLKWRGRVHFWQKHTDYIKKCFKQKLFRIKFLSKNSVDAYLVSPPGVELGSSRDYNF